MWSYNGKKETVNQDQNWMQGRNYSNQPLGKKLSAAGQGTEDSQCYSKVSIKDNSKVRNL